MHTVIRDRDNQWRVVFAWPTGGSETVLAVFENPAPAVMLANCLNGGPLFPERAELGWVFEWIGVSAVVFDANRGEQHDYSGVDKLRDNLDP